MSRRSFLMRMWLLMPVLICIPDFVGAQTAQINQPLVSFENDVLPVLKQHCFGCHSDALVEADLQFDRGRNAVVSGGQTGSSILGRSAADSDLFRRITSTTLGYRMPKQGEALSLAEVDLIRRWLDQGAPWGQVTPTNQAAADTLTERAGRHLADFSKRLAEPSFRNLFWLCVGFGVLALLSVVRTVWFSKRASSSDAMPVKKTTWKNWVIGTLLFALFATWIYYDGKANSATDELAKAKKELFKYARSPDEDPLVPPYPMHPKRLGGVYYRGNDERNEALFNGGFYRTAQLELWLVDQAGKRLKWGDAAVGPLFVEFEIQRAVQTTGELFTDRVMALIALTDSVSRDADRKIAKMKCVTPDQVWRARLPIGSPEDWPDGKIEGKLFLMQQTSKPKPHYGILFEVSVVDGNIEDTSELWMGSLYDLNGRVLVPRGDKILLDHWLDWRPIPEIEGGNTDNPELLGVPEHLGD